MVFGLFRKKDPICGMKEEKGKGITDEKTNNWFCCQQCKDKFEKAMREHTKEMSSKSSKKTCCH